MSIVVCDLRHDINRRQGTDIGFFLFVISELKQAQLGREPETAHVSLS